MAARALLMQQCVCLLNIHVETDIRMGSIAGKSLELDEQHAMLMDSCALGARAAVILRAVGLNCPRVVVSLLLTLT